MRPGSLLGIVALVIAIQVQAEVKKTAPAPVATQAKAQRKPPAPLSEKPVKPGTKVAEVQGDIPEELAGTWLLLSTATVSPQQSLSGWQTYRLTKYTDKWLVVQLVGAGNAKLDAAMEAANKNNEKLQATPELLQAATAMLRDLKEQAPEEQPDKIHLRTMEHYPKMPPPQPQSKDAKLALEFVTTKGVNAVISGSSYFIKEIAGDRVSGEFATGIVAQSPRTFIVPVNVHGEFTMHRLAPAEKK